MGGQEWVNETLQSMKQEKQGIRLASDLKDCPSTVPNNRHVKKNASFFVIAKKKSKKIGRAWTIIRTTEIGTHRGKTSSE
jgi:hypothetical protein